MLPNFVFSDEKKFNVEQHFNTLNDHAWLCDGEIGFWIVTQGQGAASVIVWPTVTKSGRNPLIFVTEEVKITEMRFLLVHYCSGTKKHFKKHAWSFQQDSAPSHGATKKMQK